MRDSVAAHERGYAMEDQLPGKKIVEPYRSEEEALGKPAHAFTARRPSNAGPTPGVIVSLDLFAGAGGFSTALLREAKANGFAVEQTILNHWQLALENSRANLGNVRVINASISDVSTQEVMPGGYVDILLASPECVMYSQARGSRPIVDQRRSSAGEVLRFLSELHVETLVLENVPEFVTWGPIDADCQPIKERRGEYFQAFLKAIRNLGYSVDFRTLVAADYGDPTTRKRTYLCAQLKRSVHFPERTHSRGGLAMGTKSWVPARAIIDFERKGLSIFDRPIPHAIKSLARIARGFRIQCEHAPLAAAYVTAVERFAAAATVYHEQIAEVPNAKTLKRPLTSGERAQAAATKDGARALHRRLVEEAFLEPVGSFSWADLLLNEGIDASIDGGMMSLGTLSAATAESVIIKQFGTSHASSIDAPVGAITAGGRKYGVAEPLPDRFIVTVNHGGDLDERKSASLNDPLYTVTCKGSHGVVEASWSDIRDAEARIARIIPEPTLIPTQTFDTERIDSIDNALPTVTASCHHGLACATFDAQTVKPEAFLASYYGAKNGLDRSPRAIVDPVPTASTANRFSLVDPVIIPQQRGAGVEFDSLDRPLRTATAQNGTGLAVPVPAAFTTPNFGERATQAPRTHDLEEPFPTATSHGAGMLLQADISPIAHGKPYVLIDGQPLMLDVLYRMLSTDELAKSMSFITEHDTYQFTKNSSSSAIVRMIGNAVAVQVARALIGVALAHRFNECTVELAA